MIHLLKRSYLGRKLLLTEFQSWSESAEDVAFAVSNLEAVSRNEKLLSGTLKDSK